MFENILIVCVGNICRSPTGEYLLKQKLATLEKNIAVSSAGIGALVGHSADSNAITVAAENGLDITTHSARQLDEAIVKQNELILVMEDWQQKEIENLYPFARGRVHLMGKWNSFEIADPYKQSKEAFIDAFEKIDKACEAWCKKI